LSSDREKNLKTKLLNIETTDDEEQQETANRNLNKLLETFLG
jgi:hypothetical protein